MKHTQLVTTALAAALFVIVNCEEAAAQADIERLKAGVARIRAEMEGQVVETGSGIVLGARDGVIYIVTAAHVVEDARTITVDLFRQPARLPAELHDEIDRDNDIAVVKVRTTVATSVLFDHGDAATLKVGTPITAIGHPTGAGWTASNGSVRSAGRALSVAHDKTMNVGNSGGPVLSGERLMGMITTVGANEAGAASLDVILRRLIDWNIPYRIRTAPDFCPVFNDILRGAWADFKGWALGPRRPVSAGDEWTPKVDLTGTSSSTLVWKQDEKHPTYVAKFTTSLDAATREKERREMIDRVSSCLSTRRVRKSPSQAPNHHWWIEENAGILNKGFLDVWLWDRAGSLELQISREQR